MSTKQWRRLKQLYLQRRRDVMVYRDRQVQKLLGMSKQQSDTADRLFEEYLQADFIVDQNVAQRGLPQAAIMQVMFGRKNANVLQRQQRDRVAAAKKRMPQIKDELIELLTDKQRGQLQQLLGKFFRFQAP